MPTRTFLHPSDQCYKLVKTEEGLLPPEKDGLYHAYHGKADRQGLWTIGYGVVNYPGGGIVHPGDTATIEQVEKWLIDGLELRAKSLNFALDLKDAKPLLQRQFDAMLDFGYNEGVAALISKCAMFPKICLNPDDPTIHRYKVDKNGVPIVGSCEFLKWVYANGVVLDDLIWRRSRDADMYAGRPFKFKS